MTDGQTDGQTHMWSAMSPPLLWVDKNHLISLNCLKQLNFTNLMIEDFGLHLISISLPYFNNTDINFTGQLIISHSYASSENSPTKRAAKFKGLQ